MAAAYNHHLQSTQPNQVRNVVGAFSTKIRHGYSYSKAQACLHKILHIILTYHPNEETSIDSNFESNADLPVESAQHRAVDVDLKPKIVESPEITESPRQSGNGGESGECSTSMKANRIEQKSSEIEEKIDDHVNVRSDGYLGLLLEAVRVVSGEFDDGELSEGQLKRRRHCMVRGDTVACEELEPKSPVMKSRRGRCRIMPIKYRDSIIQPLKSTAKRRCR